MTAVQGKIWQPREDKGKKRSGGRPPEPPDIQTEQSIELGTQTQQQFHGQFRQRKRRKLAERARLETHENEQTHISESKNRHEHSVTVQTMKTDPDSRSV